jgi:hypothetical protein
VPVPSTEPFDFACGFAQAESVDSATADDGRVSVRLITQTALLTHHHFVIFSHTVILSGAAAKSKDQPPHGDLKSDGHRQVLLRRLLS